MKHPSIKRRLIVGCGLAIVVLFTLGSFSLYWSIERHLWRELDTTILDHLDFVAAEVEYEQGVLIYDWIDEGEPAPLIGEPFFFQVWDPGTGETQRSVTLAGRNLPRPTEVTSEPRFSEIRLPDGHSARAVSVRLLPRIDEDEAVWATENNFTHDPESLPQILMLAHDLKPLKRTLYRIRRILIIGGLATLVILGFLVHLVINRSLRPLQELADDLAGRRDGMIDQPIDVPSTLPVELRPQTEAFNTLLGKITDARRRDRDFALHASHELRTPLAGVQAILENTLTRPRDAADYDERIRRALEVLLPLSDSVARILHLARIQSGESKLDLKACSLPGFVHDAWRTCEAAAARKRLSVTLPAAGEEPGVTTDPPLLRVLVNNLLDNAVRHSPEGASIDVACSATSLRVRNPCPGVTQQELDRAFEPFVQLKPSGEGMTAGIGLTLCREIAGILGFALHASVTRDGTVSFILDLEG